MSVDNNNMINELNETQTNSDYAIHSRASDKAFAKISTLQFDLSDLLSDLKSGSYGGITRSEVVLMIEGTKKELLTWNYIATLIEKNDGL